MTHAPISVEPYGEKDAEHFSQFEQLFNGFIRVAAILADQQANFLQLHLRDDALQFYQTLDAATRAIATNSLAAIRDHFSNPQLQKVHVFKLERFKFVSKKSTPKNFLVNFLEKSTQSLPDSSSNSGFWPN